MNTMFIFYLVTVIIAHEYYYFCLTLLFTYPRVEYPYAYCLLLYLPFYCCQCNNQYSYLIRSTYLIQPTSSHLPVFEESCSSRVSKALSVVESLIWFGVLLFIENYLYVHKKIFMKLRMTRCQISSPFIKETRV